MYVALSRVTSLNGLFLTGGFRSMAIKSDPRATQEYERMRRECPIKPLYSTDIISGDSLTITLLNTRSLHRHAIDIAHDHVLIQIYYALQRHKFYQIKTNQKYLHVFHIFVVSFYHVPECQIFLHVFHIFVVSFYHVP